jgi:regulatory protein
MVQDNRDEKPGRRRERRQPQPLDGERLRELALFYAGRYATTEARLAAYLKRKLRERGWSGEDQPDVAALVGRLAELRYVDDRAWGEAKARGLAARGLGQRRVRQALRHGGLGEEDMGAVLAAGEEEPDPGWAAALMFARRKRLGPYAADPEAARLPEARRKALAVLMRAGHGFDIARRVLDADADSLLAEGLPIS